MLRLAVALAALAGSAQASLVLLSPACASAAVTQAGTEAATCPDLQNTIGDATRFSACTGGRGCIPAAKLSLDNTVNTPDVSFCGLCADVAPCVGALARVMRHASVAAACSSPTDAAALMLLREQSQVRCNADAAGEVEGYMDATSRFSQCGECGIVTCKLGQYCPGGDEPAAMCPEGYYCPTPATKLRCPSGNYCPEGMWEPEPCAATSICPEGATRPISIGFLLVMVILVLPGVAGGMRLLERRRQAMQDKQRGVARKGSADPGTATDEGAALPSTRAGVLISFNELQLVTKGVTRLAGISGSIEPGRLTAILGGSGAGKTTLMNTLLGKETATGGSVTITVVRQQQGKAGQTQVGGGSSGSPSKQGSGAAEHDEGATQAAIVAYENPMHKAATVAPAPSIGTSPSSSSLISGGWTPVGSLSQGQLRYSLGFVPQTDVLLRELTVRETLLHAARTRLPFSTPAAEIERRVDETLRELGLAHVAHTIVGSAEEALAGGGLSGGERKRVSIGTELVVDPLVLVLDEPTTGLDATAALECMESVKAAASRGLTTMAVIHQPRQEIVDLCDDIIVLGRGGRPVYSGPRALLLPYFSALGYTCPEDTNPVDFVLDAVNGKHGAPPAGGGREFVQARAGRLGAGADASAAPAMHLSTSAVSLASAGVQSSGATTPAQDGAQGQTVVLGAEAMAAAVQAKGEQPTAVTAAAAASPSPSTTGKDSPTASGQQQPLFADFTAAWNGGGEEWVRVKAGARASSTLASGPSQAAGTVVQGRPAPAVPTLSSADRTALGSGSRPGFFPSTWLYFRRALLQKVRTNSLLLDSVAMLAGGCLMGIVCAGGPLFIPPVPTQYSGMCPPGAEQFCVWARRYFIAPAGFYICMVAGSLSVPPAVRAFGTEKEVFWREAGVGGHRPAYFVGKLLAEVPVYALYAAAFTAPLVAIAAWRAPQELLYCAIFVLIGTVASIAHCLAILMTSSDAASLIGVLIAILMNLFNGFVPRLGDGAVWAYTRWFERSIINAELLHGFELSENDFNRVVQPEHRDPRFGRDMGSLLAFFFVCNATAGLLLLVAHRDKQR